MNGYVITGAIINPAPNNNIANIMDKNESIINTSKKLYRNENDKNITKNDNNKKLPNMY
jgi:hypothetical protein